MTTSSGSLLLRDPAGRLVLPQPFPMAGRIFGVLFAIPGLKMLWDFVQALVEVGRANAWQLSEIPGLGFWLVFTLIVLLPGWAIATIRRRVVIDRTARDLVQVNDFLVYRWTSRRSLNDFDSVRLFVPRRTSSRSSNLTHYHVELHAGKPESVLAFIADADDDARRVGQEVALSTGLPLRDEIEHDAAERETSAEDAGTES